MFDYDKNESKFIVLTIKIKVQNKNLTKIKMATEMNHNDHIIFNRGDEKQNEETEKFKLAIDTIDPEEQKALLERIEADLVKIDAEEGEADGVKTLETSNKKHRKKILELQKNYLEGKIKVEDSVVNIEGELLKEAINDLSQKVDEASDLKILDSLKKKTRIIITAENDKLATGKAILSLEEIDGLRELEGVVMKKIRKIKKEASVEQLVDQKPAQSLEALQGKLAKIEEKLETSGGPLHRKLLRQKSFLKSEIQKAGGAIGSEKVAVSKKGVNEKWEKDAQNELAGEIAKEKSATHEEARGETLAAIISGMKQAEVKGLEGQNIWNLNVVYRFGDQESAPIKFAQAGKIWKGNEVEFKDGKVIVNLGNEKEKDSVAKVTTWEVIESDKKNAVELKFDEKENKEKDTAVEAKPSKEASGEGRFVPDLYKSYKDSTKKEELSFIKDEDKPDFLKNKDNAGKDSLLDEPATETGKFESNLDELSKIAMKKEEPSLIKNENTPDLLENKDNAGVEPQPAAAKELAPRTRGLQADQPQPVLAIEETENKQENLNADLTKDVFISSMTKSKWHNETFETLLKGAKQLTSEVDKIRVSLGLGNVLTVKVKYKGRDGYENFTGQATSSNAEGVRVAATEIAEVMGMTKAEKIQETRKFITVVEAEYGKLRGNVGTSKQNEQDFAEAIEEMNNKLEDPSTTLEMLRGIDKELNGFMDLFEKLKNPT